MRELIPGFIVAAALSSTILPSNNSGRNDQLPEVHLTRVTAVGVLDPTPADRPASGRMFGTIAKAVEASNGDLFVLDASLMKVVVVSPTGALKRVILGGPGAGPGEFRYPTAMDVNGSSVAVFDYNANRVTIFDTSGTLLRIVPTPRAKDIALLGDSLYGSYMPSGQNALWRMRIVATDREDVLPVPDSVRRFNPRGSIARVASRAGMLFVANGAPSTWYAGRLDQPRGQYALRRYNSITSPDGIAIPPGEPLAILPLANSNVGVAYTEWSSDPRQRPSVIARWIDVYDMSGKLIARGKIPFEDITSISAARDGRHLWIARRDPFPQVVKFSITY